MSMLEREKQLQFNQIMQIIKLATLAFPLIAYFQYFTKSSAGVEDFFRRSLIMILAFAILLIVYTLLYMIELKLDPKYKIKPWITPLINVISAFTAILYTGANMSDYKYLLLLPIITTGMEHRKIISLTIGSVSAVLLLAMDILLAPYEMVNTTFENDLILACLFLVVAWALNFYVELERQHSINLNKLLITDTHTGLYNYRYFIDHLEAETKKAEKENRIISLLIFNIDDFKFYNDLYGHTAGDRVLANIAQILRTNLDENTTIARPGGDGFAVVLPDTDLRRAVSIAEKIRKAVENYPFHGVENIPGKSLTISAGVAIFPEKAKTAMELVDQADDACNRAKFMRKNRVESYYSILEEIQTGADSDAKELLAVIKTLIAVINAKDRYTFRHTERVVHLSDTIAKANNFSEKDRLNLIYAAYLHDVGKVSIPEEILMKPGRLSDQEWEIMKNHPTTAAEMVKNIDSLKKTMPIIWQHHERYDGKGYPNGLKGDEIHPLAALLTVIDSFDAMTSVRPYQDPKTFEQAIEEVRRCSGNHFSPKAVEQFMHGISSLVIK
ncbi:MAG: diguanylate cyclase [Firmicutes bacterium]|nr:diguanylate cyclase [Bacillota bacterium]